jgi:hypothetical protein
MGLAKCLHEPRVMVPNGGKHKDGSPVLQCQACIRAWHLRSGRKKRQFGVWWDKQHGLCAFCGKPLADDNTTHREHNHKTGEERGLVHARCNLMIGGIENAAELLGLDALIEWMRANIT